MELPAIDPPSAGTNRIRFNGLPRGLFPWPILGPGTLARSQPHACGPPKVLIYWGANPPLASSELQPGKNARNADRNGVEPDAQRRLATAALLSVTRPAVRRLDLDLHFAAPPL